MPKQKNFSLLLEKDANEALRRTFVAEHVLLVLIESKNFSKKLFCSEKNGLNKKFFFRSSLAEMFCSSIYSIFFSAKREKFCCLNQRRILRKFFQTKQPFAKSFSFFLHSKRSSIELFFDSSIQHFFQKKNLAFSRKSLQQRKTTFRGIYFCC